MGLDPNGRYLRQEGSGMVRVWSTQLAKRPDFREIDPKTMKLVTDHNPPGDSGPRANKELIVLQDKSFHVDSDLKEVLVDMLGFIDELKAKNESLTALLEESTKPAAPEEEKPNSGKSKKGN